jgi:hypothetical protein
MQLVADASVMPLVSCTVAGGILSYVGVWKRNAVLRVSLIWIIVLKNVNSLYYRFLCVP